MWFHSELRTSENETEARVTVTVGGEENPRVLSDLCLTHHGFHNQELVSREEGARPTVQARSRTLRDGLGATKGEVEASSSSYMRGKPAELFPLFLRRAPDTNESLISLASTVFSSKHTRI